MIRRKENKYIPRNGYDPFFRRPGAPRSISPPVSLQFQKMRSLRSDSNFASYIAIRTYLLTVPLQYTPDKSAKRSLPPCLSELPYKTDVPNQRENKKKRRKKKGPGVGGGERTAQSSDFILIDSFWILSQSGKESKVTKPFVPFFQYNFRKLEP